MSKAEAAVPTTPGSFNMQQLEHHCTTGGVRITRPRRIIAHVLGRADDHPDVDEITRRARCLDPGLSDATVYRTVRLFENLKLIIRHRFEMARPATNSPARKVTTI